MSVKNPKKFWQEVSEKENWRDYILPRKNDADFDKEGFLEAERLFYFYDRNSVVVDFGCGIGRVAKYVAARAKRVIGLDINPDFVEKARRYAGSEKAEFHTPECFKEKDIADLVYSLMVLQHNDEPNRKAILEEIYELMKRGGVCVINFPRAQSDYYSETEFVHKFSRSEVEDYGKLFGEYRIIEGNLPNYEKEYDKNASHEYFLIAKK